ncbi:MAG TPA: antibiotic biosynthesis monooxygenase [Terracidiphilus sp.]|nr:antibiotic biosynthesis monooxygenase [Terracidiphilus sp.]
MIARHWRGWTKPQAADAYEQYLKQKVLPGLHSIEGYKGGYILRRDALHESEDETEFVVINFFDSLDAVRRFAGDDHTVPVFEPEAKLYLSRIDAIANHYEVRAAPA